MIDIMFIEIQVCFSSFSIPLALRHIHLSVTVLSAARLLCDRFNNFLEYWNVNRITGLFGNESPVSVWLRVSSSVSRRVMLACQIRKRTGAKVSPRLLACHRTQRNGLFMPLCWKRYFSSGRIGFLYCYFTAAADLRAEMRTAKREKPWAFLRLCHSKLPCLIPLPVHLAENALHTAVISWAEHFIACPSHAP